LYAKECADCQVPALLTSQDIWESAYREERQLRLKLEKQVEEMRLQAHSNREDSENKSSDNNSIHNNNITRNETSIEVYEHDAIRLSNTINSESKGNRQENSECTA